MSLMAMAGEDTDGNKQKVFIAELGLKVALKRVWNQIETESQAVTLGIRAEFERHVSEALRNVSTCRLVLHNRVAKICCSLPKTTALVVDFDEDIAIAKPGQPGESELNQALKDGIETGGRKNQ